MVASLPLPDGRIPGRELGTSGQGFLSFHLAQHAVAPGDPRQRLPVFAKSLTDPGLLEEELGLGQRVPGNESTGVPVGPGRLLVQAHPVPDVPQSLVGSRQFDRGHGRKMSRGFQRSPVQVSRVCERVLCLGPLPSNARVSPGFLVLLGVEEMQ